jgi:hypothetical protein
MNLNKEMKRALIILLGSTLLITSCKKKGCMDENALNYSAEAEKDDGSCSYYQIPSSYAFTDESGNNTVDYGGQTDRLNQLEEMTTYMKSGNSQTIDAAVLRDMFYNTGDNGNGNFSFSSSKQMADKCFAADTATYIAWFDSLANSSQHYASTAADGQAGILTTGTSTYLFDENGIEYVQLIEKGLMGAVHLYQATQVYFGSSKMDVDNSTAEDPGNGKYYTKMEHHWDEAFGYFGVPVDFPTNTTDIRFWGKYTNARNAQLGCNAIMMNAFLIGRTAIVNNDITTRNAQITEIRQMWERVCAATAVDYLDKALANLADDAYRMHVLSEAYAFIKCLTYLPLETRIITFPQITEALNKLGDNFWTISSTDITNCKNDITTIYGF